MGKIYIFCRKGEVEVGCLSSYSQQPNIKIRSNYSFHRTTVCQQPWKLKRLAQWQNLCPLLGIFSPKDLVITYLSQSSSLSRPLESYGSLFTTNKTKILDKFTPYFTAVTCSSKDGVTKADASSRRAKACLRNYPDVAQWFIKYMDYAKNLLFTEATSTRPEKEQERESGQLSKSNIVQTPDCISYQCNDLIKSTRPKLKKSSHKAEKMIFFVCFGSL